MKRGAQPPSESGSDLEGRVLGGRYRVLRKLGAGAMGAVYEGEDTRLEVRVAIKVMQATYAAAADHRERFLREARAASAIKSDHVVRITDFDTTDDGLLYLVMEHLEGRDLGKVLREAGALPWPRAREIFLQILEALQAAHAEKIVHRDIKPSNCFLCDGPEWQRTDRIKVLDFGLAKRTEDRSSPKITRTGILMGTPSYLAPELAKGKPADARSDLYAFGVLMYRTLVGRLPFVGDSELVVITQHLRDDPPPPRSINPEVPEAVEAIVLRMLAKEPDDRFQSARELTEALESIELSTAAASVETRPRPRTEPVTAAPPPAIIDSSPSVAPSVGIVTAPMATPEQQPVTAVYDSGHPIVSRSGNIVGVQLVEETAAAFMPVARSGSPADPPRRGTLLAISITLGLLAATTLIAVALAMRDDGAPSPAVASAAKEVAPSASDPPPVVAAFEPAPTQGDAPVTAPVEPADDSSAAPPDAAPPSPDLPVEPPAESAPPPEPATEPSEPIRRKKPEVAPTDASVQSRIRRKAKGQCKGGGVITVKAVIDSSGNPLSASSFSGGTPEARACVKSIVMAQKFPASKSRLLSFDVTT